MDKLYIAREYLLVDDYGAVRIDEEAVFSSLKDARVFLQTVEDPEVEGARLKVYRTEIVEYIVGNTETYARKWVYNLKGELIEQDPPKEAYVKQRDFDHQVKFRVGDIVYLLPKITNIQSPSVNGVFGVVVELPSVDTTYVIYYINEYGLLDHKHSPESAMVIPNEPLPGELSFLTILSKHMRNLIEIPGETFRQIVNGDIFVKNINVFDCKSMKIIDVDNV